MKKKSSSFLVPENLAGLRADRTLASLMTVSRSAASTLLKKGLGTVNGHPLKAHRILQKGDSLQIFQPNMPANPTDLDLKKQLIFEDDDLLVINKLAGQVVHPAPGTFTQTIAEAAAIYCPTIKSAAWNDSVAGRARAGVVHRLDRATSGVLLLAKNQPAVLDLQQQFKSRQVKKEYRLVACGQLPAETVNQPLDRHRRHRQRRTVTQNGKEAETIFVPKASRQVAGFVLTYAAAFPITGRTHQIRVHAAWLRHPILGDNLYSSKDAKAAAKSLKVEQLLLHAYSLSFRHPTLKKLLKFTTKEPAYLAEVRSMIENRK